MPYSAREVLAKLLRAGFVDVRQSGSHKSFTPSGGEQPTKFDIHGLFPFDGSSAKNDLTDTCGKWIDESRSGD
jgi:hypothetical protein